MVILAPGNRADVAVRCNTVGQQYMNVSKEAWDLYGSNGNFDPAGASDRCKNNPTDYRCGQYPVYGPDVLSYEDSSSPMDMSNRRKRRAESFENPPVDDMVGGFSDPNAQPTLFVIDVVAPAVDLPQEDLPSFKAPKPCYLVDLQGIPDADFEVGGKYENNNFINQYSCTARANQVRQPSGLSPFLLS